MIKSTIFRKRRLKCLRFVHALYGFVCENMMVNMRFIKYKTYAIPSTHPPKLILSMLENLTWLLFYHFTHKIYQGWNAWSQDPTYQTLEIESMSFSLKWSSKVIGNSLFSVTNINWFQSANFKYSLVCNMTLCIKCKEEGIIHQ